MQHDLMSCGFTWYLYRFHLSQVNPSAIRSDSIEYAPYIHHALIFQSDEFHLKKIRAPQSLLK